MNYLLIIPFLMAFGVLFFAAPAVSAQEDTAIFGGGCFWCMEPPFEQLDGVTDVVAGYTGGTKEDADYQKVSGGRTDHYEAVLVRFDPSRVSYKTLVETFWRQIDPTDGGGQFADRGKQYRTAIFYNSEQQKQIADASKKELDDSKLFERPVITPILPVQPFYEAEEYHQDYYRKNAVHYNMYKKGSGRQPFIERVWADNPVGADGEGDFVKPSDEELRARLS
ncbi:MAG: peptide-methionine (S)-S-oxide reductase MsrA, partial [Desulfocapsaceae bacterium]